MPNVLTWLREVDERARIDPSADRPAMQAISLVSMRRMMYADPDGTNCYPAQATLAQRTGLDRSTVRAVDQWLVRQGLMDEIRKRARGLREYVLTIAEESVDRDLADDGAGQSGGGLHNHLGDSDGGGSNHREDVDTNSDGGGGNHLNRTDGGEDHHLEPRWGPDGGPDEAQMVAATTTTFGPTTYNQREGGANPDELTSNADRSIALLSPMNGQRGAGREAELRLRIPPLESRYGPDLVRKQLLDADQRGERFTWPSQVVAMIERGAAKATARPRPESLVASKNPNCPGGCGGSYMVFNADDDAEPCPVCNRSARAS